MRARIRHLLDLAVEAVEPSRLTADALSADPPSTRHVIAIGKAAPAMCRGAARALGRLEGICVAAATSTVPAGIDLVVGDHPVPGAASLQAGHKALEVATAAHDGFIGLISGGGSALCEWPRPGIDLAFIDEVNRRLLTSGRSIEDTNLVRAHLSEIKCGGLAAASGGPVATYVLSDVAGAGPEVVASGPTLPMRHDPNEAMAILSAIGMTMTPEASRAIRAVPDEPEGHWRLEVVGDGRTAARAIAREEVGARILHWWLSGHTANAIDRLFDEAEAGLTVAVGETAPVVTNPGRGGRNTHAALLAATRIAGSEMVFAALATDGVDGSADAAGAIVDGGTIERGGDPGRSIDDFDSASYLARTGDLIVTGPTGTNVADLWLLWQP